jgi:Uncharacterised nucleotidyltransferase
MAVSILPANHRSPPGAGIEDRVLLRAVRASILGEADEPPLDVSPADADWDRLLEVATRNKLAVLLLRGLNRRISGAPQRFLARLQGQQDATVRLNTRHLVTLRHLVPILETNRVETIVIKGPCAQMLLHGDFFAKPSSDVDLLVSRRDFDRASAVIANSGFAVAEECFSLWWKVFLGEQHLLTGDRSRTAVDLHYRTQQPGCPAPWEPELFLLRRVSVAVGASKVPTLSRSYATLLSCMSLGKALVHREPAGGHVCDIAAGVRGRTPDQLAQLMEAADRQGLRNTLALGLRSACLLFGVDARLEGSGGTVLAGVRDADLLAMILRPWTGGIVWPRRSQMLKELCDSRAAYLKEVCWKAAEEACRKWYHPARLMAPRPRRA